MKILNNFFTSGWKFQDNIEDKKSQYQMLNIALILSSLGLIFGIINNFFIGDIYLIKIEIVLIFINVIMFFILRKDKKYFKYVATVLTALFALLFSFLMYSSEPSSMRHVWLFTFPIIILYFQGNKNAFLWLMAIVFIILIAPFQTFAEVTYTFRQVSYITFVILIVAAIMYFYKTKIDEAKKFIMQQQSQLLDFNAKLESEVRVKTSELRKMNKYLELTVNEKIEELIQKDKLITVQSKQAVMGEMITMIAHQWRQPLSSITLQISNLQFKSLLGKEIAKNEIHDTLSEISDTIIYLSETIDDFQTYFHPDKELTKIGLHTLLEKAVNFTLPRLKETKIAIEIKEQEEIMINVYLNELIQVVLNLLNNAIDALSSLDSRNPKIYISMEEEDKNILISISDNALGIKEDVISRIFEPYFSTKGKNGTGLGLYMSQMIIQKQFNGKIKVQSSKEGSTFIVDIPKILS